MGTCHVLFFFPIFLYEEAPSVYPKENREVKREFRISLEIRVFQCF